MFSRIYHYFRWNKMRSAPRGLATVYDKTQVDPDTRLLMLAGVARDKQSADDLKRRYGVSSATELLPLLPKPKPPPLRKRIMDWLRRIEGSYAYDPMYRELQQARRDANKLRRGQSLTRLKVRR